jgi:hypothetical protein
VEACEVCGFAWDAVEPTEVPGRVELGVEGLRSVLLDESANPTARPEPSVWSALEYAGHVRDVLFNLRDRLVLGAVEDNPVAKPLHGAPRIELGLYGLDTPEQVAADLAVAGSLFARTVRRLSPELLARPMFYPYPVAATRTVGWVAAQALHEVEHHLTDARRSAGLT